MYYQNYIIQNLMVRCFKCQDYSVSKAQAAGLLFCKSMSMVNATFLGTFCMSESHGTTKFSGTNTTLCIQKWDENIYVMEFNL